MPFNNPTCTHEHGGSAGPLMKPHEGKAVMMGLAGLAEDISPLTGPLARPPRSAHTMPQPTDICRSSLQL